MDINGPCSIAVLNYQRVSRYTRHGYKCPTLSSNELQPELQDMKARSWLASTGAIRNPWLSAMRDMTGFRGFKKVISWRYVIMGI